MAAGRVQRELIAPLLVVNLIVYLIVLGLASWSLDKYINGKQDHPHLGGNSSTNFMLVYAMAAGVTGVCSVIIGLLHFRSWRSDSLASATCLAMVSWGISALAFGFVIKQINLGGHRGKRLRTLEAFITIAFLSQLMYLLLLNAGMYNRRYGPGFHRYEVDRDRGLSSDIAMSNEPQSSSTPALI